MSEIEAPGTLQDIIQAVTEKCGGEKYLFRGESKKYPTPASSTIFRKYGEGEDGLFNEHFQAVDLQKEIIENTRRFFSEPSKEKTLADLRHFDGDTAVVDFSRNILVAIFFACNGELTDDGYLYLLKEPAPHDGGIRIIEAAKTDWSRARAEGQHSVFIETDGGYVDQGLEEIIIPNGIKSKIIQQLDDLYNINGNTIFPDLIGYINNRKNFETAMLNFYKGLAKNRLGDHAGAVLDYDEAISLDPGHAAAWSNRGAAKAEQGDHTGAVDDCDEAIRLDPTLAAAWNNRGAAKKGQGEHAGAVDDCDEASRLDPTLAEAWNNRGAAKNRLGDHTGAEADCDEAIRLDPGHAGAWTNRGAAKDAQGDHAGAEADYDEAIRLDPTLAAAWYNRGNAKRALGDHSGAVDDCDEAIRLDCGNAEAWINRGAAKNGLGKHEEALADCDEAIRLDPNLAGAWNNRGVAKAAQGKHEEAVDDCDEASRLDPTLAGGKS